MALIVPLDTIKKRESAIASLAAFDEKMRIESLEGEEKKQTQLLANYDKEIEKLTELHEAVLSNAEDRTAIEIEHIKRISELDTQYQKNKESIKKEFADKRAEEEQKRFEKQEEENQKRLDNTKKIEEFDEQRRIASMTAEEQKYEQIWLNYEKQIEKLKELHEIQLSFAENEEEMMALKEAQEDRLFEIRDERSRKIHTEMMKDEAELLDKRLGNAATVLKTIATLTEGHKGYAALYKASAIGEATINAVQSVLKTMSGTPFPWNIPLVAAQAAAAAVQVKKIASTKMYRGGMIPGRNTLIMANEEGTEAILNTRAVRAVGGPAGVDALNNGPQSVRNSYDNRKSNVVVNMYPTMVTPQIWREKIEPVLKWSEQRW